ncbi:substrate-binding domain-containing protein [Actinocorallia longicatena]|uniref:Substrate-binding domain-containing protein n=1 Tax=Actinocorallia longicatena TaxID=111803 RepID=A0ABP6QTV0_9ACTN
MHAEERHEAILRELRAQGSIRVSDLADRLGVSAITVRRDVEALAERGRLVRTHGGARLPAAEGAPRPVPEGRLSFGMVVPSAGYYFPEVIRGAREEAARHGIRLVLGISRYDPAEDAAQVGQLLDAGVDGLLITPSGAGNARLLEELPVPVVLVERRGFGRLEHVVSDHGYGGELAVRHLAGLGHANIALVARGDSPHTPWIRAGFDRALAEAGLVPGPFFATEAPDTVAPADHVDLFVKAVRDGTVDAALIHNDHDAIVLAQQLRARGTAIPDDVAIVAYDDEVAALADTPMTAVAPPKAAVGAAAVELLTRRLSEPAGPRRRIALLPELLVRASCGA